MATAPKKAAPAKKAAVPSNLLPVGEISSIPVYYNTESRKFEATLSGQKIIRASQQDLEKSIERLSSAKHVIIVGRGVKEALLVGRTSEKLIFADGNSVPVGTKVYEYDESVFNAIEENRQKISEAAKAHAEVVGNLNGVIENEKEKLVELDPTVVSVVEPAKRRKKSDQEAAEPEISEEEDEDVVVDEDEDEDEEYGDDDDDDDSVVIDDDEY